MIFFYNNIVALCLNTFLYISQSSLDPQTTWKSVTRAKTKCPAVVLSVIGDSDNFMPRPWPRAAFQTALIEAAKSGGGKLSIQFLAHLNFLMASRPSYVYPSVCPSVCLSVNFSYFRLLLQNHWATGPISTKHGTKHPWVKGIHVC